MPKGEKYLNYHRELHGDLLTERSALEIIWITEEKPNLSKTLFTLL